MGHGEAMIASKLIQVSGEQAKSTVMANITKKDYQSTRATLKTSSRMGKACNSLRMAIIIKAVLKQKLPMGLEAILGRMD